MPLELIGAGYGRTGTASLRLALNRLGYPCYHMFEVVDVKENYPEHFEFWLEVADGEAGQQHDWERVFENYRAAVDNPAAVVWRELIAAYPDAKVLLSLHPKGAQSWYRSTRETIHKPMRIWQRATLERWVPRMRRLNTVARKLIWDRFHQGTVDASEQAAVAHYQRHIEEVKATVPPEKLLVYDVSQGWEPLCDFLGEPVPGEPFPRTNERAEMAKRVRLFQVLGTVLKGLEIAAVIGVLWLLWRWLG